MDLQLKMSTFKVKNRLKYLNPSHLIKLFPEPNLRAEARKVWRKDRTLCNPRRLQFKH